MRVTLIAVGKLKEPHFRDACAEYLKRLGPYASVVVTEIDDRDVSADESRALAAEGEAILKAVPASAHVVVLDSRGAEKTSEEFSAWLADRMGSGSPDIAFVVGGAAGLDARVLSRASERLSLGRMTLPHQLARVVLLEQVYRAFRILRGEPYHR